VGEDHIGEKDKTWKT